MKNIVNMEKTTNYTLDLNAIVDFCKNASYSNDTPKKSNEFRQQEISNNYQLNEESELVLAEKIVHEIVTPQDGFSYDEFKCELIKSLLKLILDDKKPDPSASVKLAIETFKKYNFLVEI